MHACIWLEASGEPRRRRNILQTLDLSGHCDATIQSNNASWITEGFGLHMSLIGPSAIFSGGIRPLAMSLHEYLSSPGRRSAAAEAAEIRGLLSRVHTGAASSVWQYCGGDDSAWQHWCWGNAGAVVVAIICEMIGKFVVLALTIMLRSNGVAL